MTVIYVNPEQTFQRCTGDREPIGARLLDLAGNAIDLTSETVVFRMIRIPSGKLIVDDVAANLDDATTGKVSFTPSAANVSTPGEYCCYFLITTDTPINYRFPYNPCAFVMLLLDQNERP